MSLSPQPESAAQAIVAIRNKGSKSVENQRVDAVSIALCLKGLYMDVIVFMDLSQMIPNDSE